MSPRFGMALCVYVCAVLSCISGIAAEIAPPTFWVESGDLEIGPVTAGETAVATFVFHNEGDDDVQILRAAPS